MLDRCEQKGIKVERKFMRTDRLNKETFKVHSPSRIFFFQQRQTSHFAFCLHFAQRFFCLKLMMNPMFFPSVCKHRPKKTNAPQASSWFNPPPNGKEHFWHFRHKESVRLNSPLQLPLNSKQNFKGIPSCVPSRGQKGRKEETKCSYTYSDCEEWLRCGLSHRSQTECQVLHTNQPETWTCAKRLQCCVYLKHQPLATFGVHVCNCGPNVLCLRVEKHHTGTTGLFVLSDKERSCLSCSTASAAASWSWSGKHFLLDGN